MIGHKSANETRNEEEQGNEETRTRATMKIKQKIAANIQRVFPRSEYNRRRNDSSSKSKSRIFSYKGTSHFLGNEALCEKILFLLSAYFLTRNRSFFYCVTISETPCIKKTKKREQGERAKDDKISLAMKSTEEIQYVQKRVSIMYREKQRNCKETDLSQET